MKVLLKVHRDVQTSMRSATVFQRKAAHRQHGGTSDVHENGSRKGETPGGALVARAGPSETQVFHGPQDPWNRKLPNLILISSIKLG